MSKCPLNTERLGGSRKPVFDYPLSKELVPNVKPEPLPTQF